MGLLVKIDVDIAINLALGNFINMDILYMVLNGIYRGRCLSYFGVRPADRPDAIVRKAAAIGEKLHKIAIFWRFSNKLTPLPLR